MSQKLHYYAVCIRCGCFTIDGNPPSITKRYSKCRLCRQVEGQTTLEAAIEPVYRAFGAKIEYMRTVLGWTQEDLAKKVGLARGSIANLEVGRQRILLERFAHAFNSTPKNLLRGIWV